jgi:tripartite-type tricarboxylate transporter receptor subunit TctC
MRILAAILAIPALFVGPVAAQETYPARPVQIVVPFPPGGIADVVARALAPSLERNLKQPMVIVNKAGAAGGVGMQFAATSKPDGYTLLLGLVSISTIPEVDKLFGRPQSYTRDQFVGIARITADPPILVVRSESPWKTVSELVEDARKRPGQIIYSSSGPYGASHVPMEMLMEAAGVKLRHLPTTGGAPAMTAVLGGHAEMWGSPPALAFPHMRAGKLRVLAGWGEKRLAALPEVPTLKELGYSVEYYLWAGLFAPKAVPAGIIKIVGDAVRQAVHDPEFKAAMTKVETPIAYLEGDIFKAWWDRDARVLAEAVRRIGKVVN